MYDQEDEEGDEGEEDGESSAATGRRRKEKKPGKGRPKRKTIFEEALEPDSPGRKRKYRKNVLNVACTEYEVIKRVAKR